MFGAISVANTNAITIVVYSSDGSPVDTYGGYPNYLLDVVDMKGNRISSSNFTYNFTDFKTWNLSDSKFTENQPVFIRLFRYDTDRSTVEEVRIEQNIVSGISINVKSKTKSVEGMIKIIVMAPDGGIVDTYLGHPNYLLDILDTKGNRIHGSDYTYNFNDFKTWSFYPVFTENQPVIIRLFRRDVTGADVEEARIEQNIVSGAVVTIKSQTSQPSEFNLRLVITAKTADDKIIDTSSAGPNYRVDIIKKGDFNPTISTNLYSIPEGVWYLINPSNLSEGETLTVKLIRIDRKGNELDEDTKEVTLKKDNPISLISKTRAYEDRLTITAEAPDQTIIETIRDIPNYRLDIIQKGEFSPTHSMHLYNRSEGVWHFYPSNMLEGETVTIKLVREDQKGETEEASKQITLKGDMTVSLTSQTKAYEGRLTVIARSPDGSIIETVSMSPNYRVDIIKEGEFNPAHSTNLYEKSQNFWIFNPSGMREGEKVTIKLVRVDQNGETEEEQQQVTLRGDVKVVLTSQTRAYESRMTLIASNEKGNSLDLLSSLPNYFIEVIRPDEFNAAYSTEVHGFSDGKTVNFSGMGNINVGDLVTVRLQMLNEKSEISLLNQGKVQLEGNVQILITPSTFNVEQIPSIPVVIVHPGERTSLGDLSGDGVVMPFDASLILQYVLGLIKLPESRYPQFTLENADVSGDGTISPFDAALILQFSLGIITRFPVEIEVPGIPQLAHEREQIRHIGFASHSIMDSRFLLIPIEVDNCSGIYSGKIFLKYNSSLLRLDSVMAPDNSSEQLFLSSSQKNMTQISFAMPYSLTGKGTIVAAKFQILSGSIENALYTISISDVQLNEGTIPAKIISKEPVPITFSLKQNYPNPFNPETWIPYQLSESSKVVLCIYNVKGDLIKTLPLGFKESGHYFSKEEAVYWNGCNQAGEKVASGIYFYQIKAADYRSVKRMFLVK